LARRDISPKVTKFFLFPQELFITSSRKSISLGPGLLVLNQSGLLLSVCLEITFTVSKRDPPNPREAQKLMYLAISCLTSGASHLKSG